MTAWIAAFLLGVLGFMAGGMVGWCLGFDSGKEDGIMEEKRRDDERRRRQREADQCRI